MSRLVTVYGGSGFVGRYVVQRMARAGWRVRVACRRPNEALFLKSYGAVGQVEPIFCNIRSEESVRMAMTGADAVINCVGILAELRGNRFDTVQGEAAGRIARLAAELGAEHLVQISAIGADPQSHSHYARSKAAGEAAVRDAFPGAVILRPSIIFGPEDQFFNRFASMARFGPVLPISGADTRFQPVYVDDVARVTAEAAMGQVAPGLYELGGPDVMTMREMMRAMLKVIHRKRLIVEMPGFVAGIIATLCEAAQGMTRGLFVNTVLTRDQLRGLKQDNVVAPGAKGFAELGITPVPIGAVLPDYLWRFRPSGQYDDLRASVRKLQA